MITSSGKVGRREVTTTVLQADYYCNRVSYTSSYSVSRIMFCTLPFWEQDVSILPLSLVPCHHLKGKEVVFPRTKRAVGLWGSDGPWREGGAERVIDSLDYKHFPSKPIKIAATLCGSCPVSDPSRRV